MKIDKSVCDQGCLLDSDTIVEPWRFRRPRTLQSALPRAWILQGQLDPGSCLIIRITAKWMVHLKKRLREQQAVGKITYQTEPRSIPRSDAV